MQFIFSLFIKNHKDIEHPTVRSNYGKAASITGTLFNLLLFIFKFILGMMSHSVSILADAFNNLSDAGSSLIALVSFVYASRPADEDHPFGHERFEYVASLIVSFLILFFSLELFMSSLNNIINPQTVIYSVVMIVVLMGSIAIKLYMYFFQMKYAKIINSSVLKASAIDSVSDALATSVVLVGLIISYFTEFQLDGYIGIFVAIMIAKAGIEIVKETLSKLIGEAPDPAFIKQVEDKVMSYDGIYGVHDLVVHSYGNNKTFITLHAEVSADENILVSHDTIDLIEKDFMIHRNIDLVIHLDPIQINDELTSVLKLQVIQMLKNIDSMLSMHDFRIVKGKTHHNLIFDVVVPFRFKYSNQKLLQLIQSNLPQTQDGLPCYGVVTLDNAYARSINHEQIADKR